MDNPRTALAGFFAALVWSQAGYAVEFTLEQANQGEMLYQQHCAACHGADLAGSGIAPPLKGKRFDVTWRGRTADVLTFHIRRMPPAAARLSNNEYTNILAHTLAVNGFDAGRTALPKDDAQLAELTIPAVPGATIDFTTPVDKSAAQVELLRNLRPVTHAMLENPPAEDWLLWSRTYAGQSYSPLTQIDTKNVARMQPAWRSPLLHGSSMPMPLVHDGVMFLQTFPDTVLAIDATNGDVLWRYQSEGLERAHKKMGLSLHEQRVYVATSDKHVIALDVRSGNVVWEHKLSLGSEEARAQYQIRSAPLIAGDVVIQSTLAYRNVPEGSFIIGIDRKTGKERWRFNTIARPGQPGGHTWNGLPMAERNGGSVWHQGTYDPALNLVYYGIAPTYDTAPLLVASQEEGVTNEAMYTNCTVALNPDTGELVWYFQHTQNDQWDMDWVFERTLAEVPDGRGGNVKAVMNVGKNVMLDALNAATGEYLFSVDSGLQNVIIGINPITGAKTINPGKMPSPETSTDICPIPFGARSWPQTAFSPETNYVYVPITESCFKMTETGKGGWLLTTGVKFDRTEQPALEDGMMGRLQAIDVAKRRLAWNTDLTTPPSTGVLATAGGLVFAGDIDPSLKAFDAVTGELLWQTPLDDTPSSSLITYEVDDKQYIAVIVGMTNNHVRDITRFYRMWSGTEGEPGDQAGASIWVFALP